MKTEQNLDSIPVLTSDPWNICVYYPDDKKKNLKEKIMQQLLTIGKAIASDDEVTPFKIIVEYKGKPNSHSEEVND